MSDEATNTAAEQKTVEVPEKFKALVEQIEQLSVLDLADLVKVLEEKFGVSAAAPAMMMAAGAGAGADAGGADEQTDFDVELTSPGDNKIGVIKAVRAITGEGLKEAKAMVDGAPVVVKAGVPKEQAEEYKKQLEEAGAGVTLK